MPKSTTYQKGRCTFTYRVAAVILDDSELGAKCRVLLHHSARDDFWSLPGGKVELREEAEKALLREMREELNSEVQIERMLWLVENFFEHAGEKHHELGLYFLARLPKGDPHLGGDGPFESIENHHKPEPLPLTFQWFACQPEQLAKLDIRPAFLREGLVQLPKEITNIKIDSRNH